MTTEARRRAYARGRQGELVAAWWLRLKGYRVLARDFRCPVGEIDLVARRGGILAFVEVKRRATLADAGAAVAPRQQRRIRRAAEHFLQRRPNLAVLQLRFDAVLLTPGRLPCHLKDAWNADTMLP